MPSEHKFHIFDCIYPKFERKSTLFPTKYVCILLIGITNHAIAVYIYMILHRSHRNEAQVDDGCANIRTLTPENQRNTTRCYSRCVFIRFAHMQQSPDASLVQSWRVCVNRTAV